MKNMKEEWTSQYNVDPITVEEWETKLAERIETIIATRPDKVIYNPPATIVLWADGTKTVVKAHEEPYDAEKGFLLCLAKKVWKDSFHWTMRKWVWQNKDIPVDNSFYEIPFDGDE